MAAHQDAAAFAPGHPDWEGEELACAARRLSASGQHRLEELVLAEVVVDTSVAAADSLEVAADIGLVAVAEVDTDRDHAAEEAGRKHHRAVRSVERFVRGTQYAPGRTLVSEQKLE